MNRARIAVIMLMVVILSAFSGCSRSKAPLSEEETLRKKLGVRVATKLNDRVVNQVQIFDKNGRMTEERWHNPKGFIVTRKEMRYDDKTGFLKETIWCKADDIMKSKHLYEYDRQGNLVMDKWLTPFDDVKTITTYHYDKGNLVLENNKDGRNNIFYVREYRYENGNRVEFIETDNRDEVSNRHRYNYNEQGQKIEERWLNNDGELTIMRKFEYENDLLVRETQHRNEEFEQEITREYDHNGLLHTERWYDGKGELIIENTYAYNYY